MRGENVGFRQRLGRDRLEVYVPGLGTVRKGLERDGTATELGDDIPEVNDAPEGFRRTGASRLRVLCGAGEELLVGWVCSVARIN